jgi:SAM-dependent methyltransferase
MSVNIRSLGASFLRCGTPFSIRGIMAEITEAFDNPTSWNEFVSERSFLRDREYIREIVDNAVNFGVASSLLGQLGPTQVHVTGENFRETLVASGLNPRYRAIMELIANEPWFGDPMTATIYAAEALTPFALAMRGRFPRFIGSGYVSEETTRGALYPIEFQDLTKLTLLSDMFDCVITNDCLEHVPDIDSCLKEMLRVLRKGGVMLSTFPFSHKYENIVKARLVGDQVEFLMEPEYHGNPAEPNKGSLVFEIPGWKIVDMADAAGFSVSEMVFMSSIEKGITGAEIAGIFILRCYK